MIAAIDMFAGLGGFSEGARKAGVRVVWAANHWRSAVDTHALNNPETVHLCQDLQQADFTAIPRHDIGLGSPSCQGHSKARGTDKPRHDAARSTAWAIVSCAEVHRQKAWIIENVPEFLTWALFPAWCAAMKALGYAISAQILDAADFSVPQNRRRAFVIATRSKVPLWPDFKRLPHVAASTVVTDAGVWSPTDSKCENTRARIENGRKAHGSRFLIAYYGNEKGGRSLDRPIGTITTKDRYALVDGDRMKMLTVDEYRDFMAFRTDYILPPQSTLAKHMLGNAVCPPVACAVIEAVKGKL